MREKLTLQKPNTFQVKVLKNFLVRKCLRKSRSLTTSTGLSTACVSCVKPRITKSNSNTPIQAKKHGSTKKSNPKHGPTNYVI